MRRTGVFLMVLLLLLVQWICCGQVLIVSVFSQSHVMEFLTCAEAMREKGLEVTVAAYEEARASIEEKGFQFKSIGCRAKIQLPSRGQAFVSNVETGSSVKDMLWVFRHLYDAGFNDTYQVMTEKQYDAYIVDVYNLHAVDIAAKLNLPFMIFQPGGIMYHEFTSYIPKSFFAERISKMQGIWHRFSENVLEFGKLVYYIAPEILKLNEVRGKYGIGPSYRLFDRWEGRPVLSHSFFGVEYARPISPLTIQVGPLFTKGNGPTEADQPLKQWLDSVKQQNDYVVYIAFGTQFSMNAWQTETILEGLSQDPKAKILFVIKETQKSSVGYEQWKLKYPNVRVENWLNQQMVLEHSAVQLFVSHAGWKSVGEALMNHKPMLLLPLALDQYGVALRLEDAEVALRLNKIQFTSEEVASKSVTLLRDPKFQRNAVKLHKITDWYGGAQKVAQFVQLFIDVGPDFLIPVQNKFSWLSRTDADIIIFGCIFLVTIRYVLAKLVASTEKTKM